jgi:hypothetical protein
MQDATSQKQSILLVTFLVEELKNVALKLINLAQNMDE